MRLSYIMKVAAAGMTAAILFSCSDSGIRTITLTNDTELSRVAETIEIDFDVLPKAFTIDNAIVLDADGNQIPVQVYGEADGSKKLLFQADVPAYSSAEYTLTTGVREEFKTLAYSRYVPERMDDYAYENNLIAGRIYGPALKDPRTFGSDIWLKCTDRLVIDDWFAKADYHHNYGEGMDCYKVANTLGGGALVPFSDGKIFIGDNYASQEHICDGPVRTKARFTYNEFDVNGVKVSATREISLDANSRFVKSTTWFKADCNSLQAVLGAVLHDVIAREDGENYIAFTEKASDSQDPDRDGNISVGLVLDDDIKVSGTGTEQGHAVIYTEVIPGQAASVWTGSGWSQGGIASQEEWAETVKDFAYAQANPLVIDIK